MPKKQPIATSNMSIEPAGRDLLLKLLHSLCRRNSVAVGAIAILCYLLLIVMPGIYISKLYQQTLGSQLLSILDYRELPFAIFVSLIVAPSVWVFYEWQLRGVSHMLLSLNENKVIGKPIGNFQSKDDFLVRATAIADHPLIISLPLIVTIVGAIIWIASLTPANPFAFGAREFWWRVNPFYFWLVWLPLVMVNLYMGICIVIRQVIATSCLRRLFRAFELELKLFHPDQCNGLAPIGTYILKISLMAVLLGFWVFAAISFPMLYGQPTNIKADTILLFLLYIFIAPSVVFLSAWGTHREMVNVKEKDLSALALQIQSIMEQTETSKILSEKEMLDELYKRYQILQNELKTWPLQISALRSYGLAAITPILSTATSFLIDNYVLKKP